MPEPAPPPARVFTSLAQMNSSRQFTRRRFLATAGPALAAPFILPGCAVGGRDRLQPSDRITLGFIGTGTQGKALLRAFLPRPDVQVLAVCDVDANRRVHAQNLVAQLAPAAAASRCAAYNDFRDLLARSDIDGVVIATPDHWHALIAIAAAKAGKDIYCEKPMNHTIREGRAMVDAVRAHDRMLQVGSMQRSMSQFRAAAELIRNGLLGKVDRVEIALTGSAKGLPAVPCDLPAEKPEPGLDWDLWLGPAPRHPYNSILSPRGLHKGYPQWRHYREYGGGGIADWGAHHLDIVHWAFDFDASGPVEVLPAPEPEAVSGVRVRYATGLEVTHIPDGNGITFHGAAGKIFVSREKFQVWLEGKLKAKDVDAGPRLLKEALPANAVRLYRSSNHLTDWLNSMRTRRLPLCDVETGHRSATACNLMNLAYYHHERIQWNPETEEFAGGAGNPAWLTREYRAPWRLG